jgi:hypothetical protein
MVFISSRPLGIYAPDKVMSTKACSGHQKKSPLNCAPGKRGGNGCRIPPGTFILDCSPNDAECYDDEKEVVGSLKWQMN